MILDQIIVEVIKPLKLMPKKVSVTTNVKVIHHNDQTIKASQLVTIGSNYDKTIKEDNLIHSVVDQGAFIKDFN